RYPALQEGALTKIRSALVNQESLANFARALSLGEYLRLGKGEKEMHGNDRDSTISDLFEAFTGAIFLDQGLDTAKRFFLDILNRQVPDPAAVLADLNPKGSLQEFTQHLGKGVPQYKVLSVSGPDHKPVYEVAVLLNGIEPESASAPNRKQAEGLAAGKLLARLKREFNTETKENEK
ncbi:MAG: ribonuclease III, partial [Lentisphaeria bacterium]|nr:ribonuclease III [Lentisphaeria bacterium]